MPNAGEDNLPYRWPVNFMLQSNGMVAIKPPFSNLTAYDMNTGEQLYSIPNGEIMTLEAQGITGVGAQTPRSGPVATAGGLLFVNTASDRAFRARDADTGEVLWEHRFDAGTEGVPAVYEVERAAVYHRAGRRCRPLPRRTGPARTGAEPLRHLRPAGRRAVMLRAVGLAPRIGHAAGQRHVPMRRTMT